MRWVVGLIIGVILGFLLGGIQPRLDLQDRDQQLKALQAELAASKKGGRKGFLPLPDLGVATAPEAHHGPPDRDGQAPEADPEDPDAPEAAPAEAPDAPDQPPPPPPSKEEQLKSFDLAVDAQRVRAQQSRAALQEQAGLSDDEMAEFDDIVAQMNEDLATYGDEVLRWSTEEPETREALGVAHDVTGILYDGQAAMEELVGDDALGDVDEASRQIWNYVDLDTFRPAVEAELDAEAAGGRP